MAPGATEEQAERPRVVYDTGVVLQAVLNPEGPAARAVRMMDVGQVEVYVSNRLRAEYEETLTDSHLRTLFPRLTEVRVRAMLDRMDALAQRIPNPPRRLAYPRDADDEPVLNLAAHVGAHYILSRDRDLLELTSHALLRRLLPLLRITDPVTFLREMDREGR